LNPRTAENNVNYQQRAAEFAVGDVVVPYGHTSDLAGRVSAVFLAIGMVEVEFPSGSKRYPVEDLQRFDKDNNAIPPHTDSVPGGLPTVSVPGGPVAPFPEEVRNASTLASADRVAQAYVKRALYWGCSDRQYRATASEVATGKYHCPKCKSRGIVSILKPASYKRREGLSTHLLACKTPDCVFLVKPSDILNSPEATALREVA
jgi:hypothetical protein